MKIRKEVVNEETITLSNSQVVASIPKKSLDFLPLFPQHLQKHRQGKQFKKFMDFFDKVSINIPFAEEIKKMSSSVKFVKDILLRKRRLDEFETVVLTEECSAISQKNLPPKFNDLGSFTSLALLGDTKLWQSIM